MAEQVGITGGCRCKSTRYTLAVRALPKAYACHCLDCQSWSGSAFSQQLVLPEDRLTVTGPLVEYTYQSPSGAQSRQRMCGTCHARVYNTNSAMTGVAMVRAGTLDASDQLDTPVHIWVKRKQPWLRLPDDAQLFEETPPREALARLLAR